MCYLENGSLGRPDWKFAMRTQLTARFVESLKSPERGQIEHWDTKVPGFGLRTSTGGRKTWTLLYRYQGRLRRLSVGTFPPISLADARGLARRALADVQRGKDPATTKQQNRTADSFVELAERYLREHAEPKKRASSVYEDRKLLKRELLPAWGARKAQDIGRRDVIALVDRIAAKPAPIAANRALSLASKIFNFGVSKELISINPAWRVPKPGKERSVTRTLDDDEIRAVWKVLDHEAYGNLFKLLLLLGQRRGETSGMRWSEIDFENAWWMIPATRTKNGLEHRVPLGKTALALLRNVPVQDRENFVFPGLRGKNPVVNLAKPLSRIIKRAEAILNRGSVAANASELRFTIHDLRRTAATGMASVGILPTIIARILNHSGAMSPNRVTLVYDRYSYEREKRDALTRWESRLSQVVSISVEANRSATVAADTRESDDQRSTLA
jgi:integrase